MGNFCSGPVQGWLWENRIICLWSLELSLEVGWGEQRACPHGQEEKWDVGL